MNKCLVCFHPIDDDREYHSQCAKKLFDSSTNIPVINFGMDSILELAEKAVAAQTNITGVQPKISLTHVTDETGIGRLSIDYKGQYILKPQSDRYPEMPEVEALTMQMAEEAKIFVVPHGLIRLADGVLAYITRRVDRVNDSKVHQEDLCQLSERLTEDKYKSSCERVGKVIKQHALFPKLAMADYFQLVVFNYLHGNNDMHMKNYSLTHHLAGMQLTSAYDLLNVRILFPEDDEESALTINGRKKNLKLRDFVALADNLGLTPSQRESVFKLFKKARPGFEKAIDRSLLSDELQAAYTKVLNKNYQFLEAK